MDNEIRNRKSWNSFLFNAIIAIIYLLTTCVLFVARRSPDPIGIGVLQWVLILGHLMLTILFYIFIARKESRWKTLRFSVGGLLSVVILYLLLTAPIWNVLWNLRKV